MRWLPVSARSLLKRRLQTYDRILPGVALSPFFDRYGKVQTIMLLQQQTADICFYDPNQIQSQVGLWRSIQLACDAGQLKRWQDAPPALRGCWHYDPDWLLSDPRYLGQAIVPLIKATNCCNCFLVNVSGVYFRRDLSQLLWVLQKSEDNAQLVRFSRQMLPEPPALPEMVSPQPETVGRTWRLAPFWETNSLTVFRRSKSRRPSGQV